MTPTTNPYATPAFAKTVQVVPIETMEQRRRRENREALDACAVEAMTEFEHSCRGARYSILAAVFFWVTIFICWGMIR